MQTVYLVLSDCGDGSNTINWFRKTPFDELYKLVDDDPNTWGSGDGLQYQELKFADHFNLDMFAELNNIYWADDEENF